MNILEKIVKLKRVEVAENKKKKSLKKLEKNSFFFRETFSLKNRIKKDNIGIIAEFKLKSPTKGKINSYSNLSINKVIKGYEKAGAVGVSILTDYPFFFGKKEHLEKSRSIISIPILRKDFIIDEYQIIESKSIGADVILLIAKILSKKKIIDFSFLAKSIGLEVILEIHDDSEIEKIPEYNIDFLGINSRNLSVFSINKNNCIKLSNKLSSYDHLKIAESGIENVEKILNLKKNGFNAFLIGYHFMRNRYPEKICKKFVDFFKNEK